MAFLTGRLVVLGVGINGLEADVGGIALVLLVLPKTKHEAAEAEGCCWPNWKLVGITGTDWAPCTVEVLLSDEAPMNMKGVDPALLPKMPDAPV